MIPRFYDASAGRITIDGQDVREVTLESLRNAVGLVQQDVFLFDDGIDSNIAYADPEAEIHELIDAARTAQIHDFAASLPGAYATRIGERGMGLSGGQRQRLSIARGMVPDPAVVVFDDATSAVDAATEHQLRHALRAATGEQSTIIISHRLGSLLHADEIIVLDAGRIIERGTHGRLIADGGYYAALCQRPEPECCGRRSGMSGFALGGGGHGGGSGGEIDEEIYAPFDASVQDVSR